MMALVLIIGTFIVCGTGCLVWKYRLNAAAVRRQPASPARRREDARDWQRRFGTDSVLAANFLQPTQNEILETLSVLDHLSPGWEASGTEAVELSFLNELALSFPSLCKTPCSFPLPFVARPNALRAKEEEIAVRRENFRTSRAQSNALEQIVWGSDTAAEGTPGSAPVYPLDADSGRRSPSSFRPALLAGVAVLIVAGLVGFHFFPHPVNLKSVHQQFVDAFAQVSAAEPTVTAKPSPTLPAIAAPVAEASPPPSPALTAAVVPDATPAPRPPATPSKEKIALDQQIAASKQRAVSKYPALAVEGSEINVRFVFRYKNLVQQNSPRLLDPNWPEKLVEECAAASGAPPKHNGFTQVLGTPR